jgi:hypothetical protein
MPVQAPLVLSRSVAARVAASRGTSPAGSTASGTSIAAMRLPSFAASPGERRLTGTSAVSSRPHVSRP